MYQMNNREENNMESGPVLTIITINRNNAVGLEKTMKSVLSQTCKAFEYVVVDGASTDNSVEVIRRCAEEFGDRIQWISEPDKGIYSAMNKGIRMATGEYLEFLNSGDCLVDDEVVSKMYAALEEKGHPSILYGNMLKDMPNGRIMGDKCFAGEKITLLGMYHGCLNHSPAYIQRRLFTKYGEYDESLRICSDWKWYVNAIVLGAEEPCYVDLDVTLFDMTGISETNKGLMDSERSLLLKQMIPSGILADYDRWYSDILVMRRINRYPVIRGFVWFVERVLFKYEKMKSRKAANGKKN